MGAIKNSLVGFVVSFVGSVPLGYLNVIGFEIYDKWGIEKLLLYLFGVVFIEVFVVYFTLIFADKLVKNNKLMKSIDVFGVFFLLFLAFSFYSYSNQTISGHHYLEQYISYSPFLIGLLLSSLNFLQLPFWTAWNLYLINGNYITTGKKNSFYYVSGTLLGTLSGMITLVFCLNTLVGNTASFSKYIMPVVIPLFFVGLAFFQGYKVFKKYYKY